MSKSILSNSLSNLGGAVLPAVTMVFTLPILVRLLGVELYGVLTLVMAITGYFSVIDVNVTAGSTKYLAEFNAKGQHDVANQVVNFGLIFYGGIGLIGAVAIYLAGPQLVIWLMKSSAEHKVLAERVLQWAALGFLFGQLQSYLNSVPQALQRYDVSARLEILFGVFVPVASVLALWLGFGLLGVVIMRVVCSGLHCLLLFSCIRALMTDLQWTLPKLALVKQITHFSAFSYLSKLAAMSHAHADKLIIGSLMGMSALTYYSVAAQIVGQVPHLTARLSGVFFPASSAMQARGQTQVLNLLYLTASRYLTLLNGGSFLLICLFGRELLHYWIGPDFADHAYYVLLFFSVALFMDSLTTLPSVINDGLGFPKLTGLFSIARALLTIALTYVLARNFSLEWVAMGGTIAAIVLGIGFLVIVHGRTVPVSFSTLIKQAYARPVLLLVAVGLLGFSLRPENVMSIPLTLTSATAVTIIGLALTFAVVVLPQHRDRLIGFLRAKA